MKITLSDGFMEAAIEPQDLELEVPCPACRLGKNPSGGECSTCRGKNYVVTPIGRQILSFVIANAKDFRAGKI